MKRDSMVRLAHHLQRTAGHLTTGYGSVRFVWVNMSKGRFGKVVKPSRTLKKDDQIYGQMLAEMAKKHSSEAFYALDDPLEAGVFSALVELLKALEKIKEK